MGKGWRQLPLRFWGAPPSLKLRWAGGGGGQVAETILVRGEGVPMELQGYVTADSRLLMRSMCFCSAAARYAKVRRKAGMAVRPASSW